MLRIGWLLGLLLSFTPSAVAQEGEGAEQQYDHVVIILDASGSMSGRFGSAGGNKMEGAKVALKRVLSATPPGTRIGLLVFGGGTGWAYPLGELDQAKLDKAIDRVQPDGGTPLGTYMKKGGDALLQARERQHGYGTYRLLVVTDGEAGDPKLVRRYTPDILDRGLVLDVIGVKMPSDHMLKGVAHSYRSADDPESLQRAVSEVMAEVSMAGDDSVGGDAFEVLDGLPDAFALAAIEALASSPGLNHPIGQRPPRKEAPPGSAPSPSPSSSTPDADVSCAVVGGALPASITTWLLVSALIRRRPADGE